MDRCSGAGVGRGPSGISLVSAPATTGGSAVSTDTQGSRPLSLAQTSAPARLGILQAEEHGLQLRVLFGSHPGFRGLRGSEDRSERLDAEVDPGGQDAVGQ